MYCQHCGTQVQDGQKFCGQCGRAVAIAPLPLNDSRVARHIRLLSILWIARGALNALGGISILVFGHIFLPFLRNAMNGVPFLDLIVAAISASGWITLALAAANVAVGVGLLNYESWGRPLALVMAFLALIHPPLGTALGIYTLWVLLPSRSEQEYQKMARAA
jgi:hypothetical protein